MIRLQAGLGLFADDRHTRFERTHKARMAEFLTTSEITVRLESMIGDAKNSLVLISPYLSVNERLRNRIEDKARSGVPVYIIYRHREQSSEVNEWLDSLTNVETRFCENLHAKCYLNEREAILTSMNLYEFSQINNYEMGVLISKRTDPRLFENIVSEVKHIKGASTTVREMERSRPDGPPIMKVVVTVLDRFRSMLSEDLEPAPTQLAEGSTESGVKETRTQSRTKLDAPQTGFCIRCKGTIPAKPTQPYCGRCFRSWNRYKNNEYREKYCQLCGNEHETSMSKPACLACYRKYRNVLEFPAS